MVIVRLIQWDVCSVGSGGLLDAGSGWEILSTLPTAEGSPGRGGRISLRCITNGRQALVKENFDDWNNSGWGSDGGGDRCDSRSTGYLFTALAASPRRVNEDGSSRYFEICPAIMSFGRTSSYIATSRSGVIRWLMTVPVATVRRSEFGTWDAERSSEVLCGGLLAVYVHSG